MMEDDILLPAARCPSTAARSGRASALKHGAKPKGTFPVRCTSSSQDFKFQGNIFKSLGEHFQIPREHFSYVQNQDDQSYPPFTELGNNRDHFFVGTRTFWWELVLFPGLAAVRGTFRKGNS